MRNSKEYLKRLANKIILETLEGKANEVMEKIKSNSFDYVAEGNVCECGSKEFYEGECVECGAMKGGAEMLEKLHGGQRKLDKNKNGRLDRQDFKMLRGDMQEKDCMECGSNMKGDFMEGNVCECGGEMREGMCMECGKMKDEILEYDSNQYGTGGMELEEKWKGDVKVKKTGEHAGKSISDIDSRLKALKDLTQSYQDKGERVPKKLKEKISELYFAKRSKKGWPGKGKVDIDEEMENESSDQEKAEHLMYMTGMPYDEALMIVRRGENIELPEGNAFTGKLAHTQKGGKFKLGNKEYTDNSNLEETLYRLVDGDESALFTENEIIDIIENIVKEEKDNIKKGATPKGLGKYEKIHKESGKENKDHLDKTAQKMISYLKSGSKGKYETNPKHFPKGNGQLAKMDKKAYEIDQEGIDYNMEVSGLNIPDYDEVKPSKETIENQIKGSSTNGNNQDWANAENTGVNDKFAKYFENDQLAKWKDESYGRVPSPVYDELPEGKKSKKSKTGKTVKEEFDRIKSLMGYNQKTQ